MIKSFRVQNYKALRDVALELTPIHVLIGPNDSGKTSLLESMAALFNVTKKTNTKPILDRELADPQVPEPHLNRRPLTKLKDLKLKLEL